MALRPPVELPRPLDYMHIEALRGLPKLLDAIGFRRGLLLGHSDGASIAAIYAGAHQDHRVQGVAMIAPHFIVEDISVASRSPRSRQAYETTDLKAKLARWHKRRRQRVLRLERRLARPAIPRLGYFGIPRLYPGAGAILQGVDDQYGTIRQIEIAQEECYCPVDVTVIPGAGHSPHREAPGATLDAISEFANAVLRGDEGARGSAA